MGRTEPPLPPRAAAGLGGARAADVPPDTRRLRPLPGVAAQRARRARKAGDAGGALDGRRARRPRRGRAAGARRAADPVLARRAAPPEADRPDRADRTGAGAPRLLSGRRSAADVR